MNTNKSSPHNGLTILNKMKNNEQTAIMPYIKTKRLHSLYNYYIEVSVRYSSDICF